MPQTRRGDTPPPRTGLSEKDVLVGFLDYLRVCVIGKVQDVSEPLVRTPRVPSGTNLLGLLKHLTYVEQYTFLGETVTDWPSTFHARPTSPSTLSSLPVRTRLHGRMTSLPRATTLRRRHQGRSSVTTVPRCAGRLPT